MAIETPVRPGRPPLAGEDLNTPRWEDARVWLRVYADLLEFKRGVLERVEVGLRELQPVAREAAHEDLGIIRTQMEDYQQRISLWYKRVWELQGLWIDPDCRIVRYQGLEALLTDREAQLLQFLVDNPHRYYTAEEILARAWGEPDHFPEQVRNYVSRLRKILSRLGTPCEITNRPRRGYSLVYGERGA
ncbi:MAG: hypothetical protein NVSMB17_07160 [Candidatus Dormibacteria bacterium]